MDFKIKNWLTRDPDPETRAELQKLVEDKKEQEIEQRFAGRLEFGTAGLRGVLGAGPTRMNRLVVRETTLGLANYLLLTIHDTKQRGVVIGFDGRRGSRVFAEDVAAVFATLEIPAHLFEREVPTPVCAFAVRELNCAAGVMVTASHNPPEYNGYKVYWENGAQIIPPHDQGIAEQIKLASTISIPWLDPAALRRSGRIRSVDHRFIEKYLRGVEALSIHSPSKTAKNLPIVYTPLHGVGAYVAETALKNAGFTNIHTVVEQREPDGNFPTVRFPNPEEPGAMDLAFKLAEQIGAAYVFANDPDADRLAVGIPTENGSYRMLSGDEVGVLLAVDRMVKADKNAAFATTIVSSRLLGVIAQARGFDYFETLTGFKWIANAGLAREAIGRKFAFGYEEALGYTVGTLVRDKDGISALVAFAEMAADWHDRGMSTSSVLQDIYRAHGLYATRQKSLALNPATALPSEHLRKHPPKKIAGHNVVSTADLLLGEKKLADGTQQKIELPTSDVLVYILDNNARIIVRPSGTEPKIKCYYEVCEKVGASESMDAALERAQKQLNVLENAHQKELVS